LEHHLTVGGNAGRDYAAANALVGNTDDDIRAAMDDKFPKPV
jgi:hypothetical protein